MPRRGENIRKRKDGRWEGRHICGYDPISKKAKYKSIYGRTYKDVKEKMDLIKFKHSIGEEVCIPHNKPFGRYIQEWFDNKKNSLKESSKNKYLHIINNHILPELGHIKAKDLSTDVIRTFLLKKKQSGNIKEGSSLSNSSMATITYILKAVLAYCKTHNYVRSTVLVDVTFSKDNPKNIKILSSSEQALLDKYLSSHEEPKNLGIMLSLYCGLRIGEICALKWQDVDLFSGIVSVNYTVQRVRNPDPASSHKTILRIDVPKSAASKRTIPLPDFLIDYISAHYDTKAYPETFMLNHSNCTPVDPRTMQYHFKKILEENGIAYVNYHVLRHTFATESIAMGFDVKTLSQILGHSNINITLSRYVHPSVDQMRAMMNYWSSNKGQIYGNTP